jgi:hypothetical protein
MTCSEGVDLFQKLSAQAAQTHPKELLAKEKMICGECFAALSRWKETLEHFCNTAPMPKSIFVGERERREMYGAFCRLLLRMEPDVGCVRSKIGACLSLEQKIYQTTRLEVQTKAVLVQGLASGELSDAQAEAVRTVLDDHREAREELLARVQTFRADLLNFIEEKAERFSDRALIAADMKREGEGCDPHALIRLCTEMCLAIDRFMREHQPKGEHPL